MSHPNTRLIVTSLISLIVGYIVSWGIMVGVLHTELRLYGFFYLSAVAFLVAFILITLLDTPLNLRTFEWAEAFWPKGLELPEPKPRTEKRFSFDRMGNSLRVAGFIVLVVSAIAGFASLIPQVESPAPEVLEISGELSGPELAALGEEILRSADSGCLACHGLGQAGLRAPDLAGVGGRAADRVPGESAEAYLRESLETPCAYVVEGYDCIMPQTLAQTLGPAKITALIAFLQSQGGEITVSLSGDEAAESSAAETGGGTIGIAGATAEEIFTNATCINCHQLDALGATGAVGPDLSQVGARLSPEEIRESILTPDAVIAEACPPNNDPCLPGLMPKTFGDQLSAMQIEILVTFLSEQQ